ncbi:HAUS augmin-like complex subunit 3 [Rhincodon typus]|uniref:HAUS augmin-like complex subunit 3 n=1 Tax=Rhincodon typus TaxID=259920 RepID=UPI00202E1755|nr:HAUS augmin-like complex subunit 3 [Rhincodon typus]
MSGGKVFVETLRRIAYHKASQLNGENFDWWFDIGDEKKLIEWFCHNINEQNVLTEEELTEFKSLGPKHRLSQKDLDKVLATCPKGAESRHGNLPVMTVEKLEEEVKELQLIRNLKIQRRNKQQLMASGIHHMPMRLKDEEEECTKLLRDTQEQLVAENAKLNFTLSKVFEEVQQLTAIYSTTGSERRPGQQTIFLSQLSLDNYLQQEEQCTAALTEYTKKQLFKGITELVESSDIEKFQLVDITSQSLQGECNEIRTDYRQQMARIQAAYNSGQRQLILAKAKEQSTKARLQHMEQIISLMRNRKAFATGIMKSRAELCQIFDVDNKQQQLFRTFSGLEQEARNLQQEVISLKEQLGTTQREHSYLLSALESDIERLRSVMYSSSKQLLLHCEELSEPLQRLECQLQRLPQIIGNIADNIKSKRQILASNLSLQGERVLYVYFFQDPDKLKAIVENLERKISTQNIGSES